MTYSFNLIDQPWIRCTYPDNHVEELSLQKTITHSGSLTGIVGDSPLETASIYRLLLAILHSASRGPVSTNQWQQLWKGGTWDTSWLNDYLSKWKHCFDIFDHNKPFYQSKDDRVKEKSVINLALDMVSGNMAVLFDHHTEEEVTKITPAKAARLVITAQTYGLAGLSGLPQKYTDAPWTRGIVFFIEGDSLFETLAYNLIRYDDGYPKYFPATPSDRPAWESDDPYLPERTIPLGYLDYLTWLNRRILLIPEGEIDDPFVAKMTVAPALRLDQSLLDPMKHYRKVEDGYLPLRFVEDRALWRDSSALFQLHNQGLHPPMNIEWLSNLIDDGYLTQYGSYRVAAMGMANNKARIDFYQEQHLPLPADYLKNEELIDALAMALSLAENVGQATINSARWLALLVISPGSDGKRWGEIDRISKDQASKLCQHWAVERHFWGQLEIPFMKLLEDLPNQKTLDLSNWTDKLKMVAWRALEQVASQAGENPVALKASVRARSNLGYRLNEILSETKQEDII